MSQAHEVISAIILVAMFSLILVFIIVFLIRFKQRQIEYHREKEEIKRVFEEEALRAQLEICEVAMRSTAKDILSRIERPLVLANILLGDSEAQDKNVRVQSREHIKRAQEELRDIASTLNENFVLSLGFENALNKEIERISRSGEKKFKISIDLDDLTGIDNQTKIFLFRSLQEAFSNAIRHSEATEIKLSVKKQDSHVFAEVSDNGRGITQSRIEKEGLGLSTIEKRIKLLRGKMELESDSSKGTSLKLRFPIKVENQDN